MGSDIAVFREIGGEFMAYFNLQDPQSLADLIIGFQRSGQFPAARNVADWQWIGWREASQQLAERSVRNALGAPEESPQATKGAVARLTYG